MNKQSCGTLYICATPIGNLGDITLRVLETLQNVDLVACEDTRKTLQLLNHFSIKKPLTSYYEHNKTFKGSYLINRLLNGENIALVSDAGMPGISDPGFELINECLANNIPYTVLPGASAAATALVLSGLANERYCFEGFLPRNKKERTAILEQLAQEERTMILYEAPHHLNAALQDLANALSPDHPMVACRELTKRFEEAVRGTIAEVQAHFSQNEPRGEFVLVISGLAPQDEPKKELPWALNRLEELLNADMREKDAIKQAAAEAALPKREVYNAYMALKNQK